MRRLRAWVFRAADLFTRDRRDRDLADEIESHLQIHTEDNIRSGMSPAAARRAALVKLGGVDSLKERYREQRGIPFAAQLSQDLRYAVRMLRRSPGLTSIAGLTLALGIAGPTVMFSMTKAWILDPLPFAQSHALVDLRGLDTESGDRRGINPADFLDWQRSARSFEDLAAYYQDDIRLTGGERAERARGARVTPNFFRLLGTQAALGRVFGSSDGEPGALPVAVLSDGLWRERFGGDPTIVGRSLRLDGEDHTVVGVLPETFQFTLLGRMAVWTPLVFSPEAAANRRPQYLVGLGRLRHDRTIDQARTELEGIARNLATTYPDTNGRRGVRALTLADEVRLHHDAGFLVPVLFAMVGCVLLIACVNVTNVMLARASARRQEMAVRLALGASRGRIIRQWITEHLVLFLTASAVGALLAVYGTAWVTNAIPYENRAFLRNYAVLTVDRTTLAFALVVGALCGVLFGWLSAWISFKVDVNTDLHDTSGRTTAGTASTRLRGSLAASEMALALAFLISAGLLVQTARNITRVDVGFDPRRLLTASVSLDERRYDSDSAVRDFYEKLTADLAGRPGVVSAGGGSTVPFGTADRGTEFFMEGQPDLPPRDTPVAALNHVTSRYGETLRLRQVRGRLLSAADAAEAPKVAMINETLARRYFSGRDPIGQGLRLRRESQDVWRIVGIVADVKNYETTDASEPQIYVPFAQQPVREMTVVVRASGDPEALAGTVRHAVAALDPQEPVSRVFTMEALIGQVTTPYRTTSTFVAFFGVVTLLLAGVGVYGVISYTFSQRTREIGLRMALGARRADVAWLVFRQVRTFVLAGLIPGLILAWALAQAMKAILFGVTPTDWQVYVAMCLVLTAVMLLAALVPARRATAVDPMTALRCE